MGKTVYVQAKAGSPSARRVGIEIIMAEMSNIKPKIALREEGGD